MYCNNDWEFDEVVSVVAKHTLPHIAKRKPERMVAVSQKGMLGENFDLSNWIASYDCFAKFLGTEILTKQDKIYLQL